jgi:hypothetical protein
MTTVYKLYRPASVKLPDDQVMHRCLVYVTSDGLQIFTEPAQVPAWLSPIDFASTPEPRKSRPHIGIDLPTADGLVVITPTGGCESCGSRFRGWQPSWATNVQKWPTS